MKVLMLASYFYKEGVRGFDINKTGYGLLIPEMAMSVGADNEVWLQTYRNTSPFDLVSDYGRCHVAKKPLINTKSFKPKGVCRGLNSMLVCSDSLHNKIHNFYYWLNYGNVFDTIRKYKPDIVHINNICEPFIAACVDSKTPYVVSLHGLNGFLQHISDDVRRREEEFITNAYKNNQIITVISSGIKRRIEKEYLNGQRASNVVVVTNGTDIYRGFSSEKKILENNRKIITAIGSVCERKNQMQIIEAVRLLGDRFNGWELHICGADLLNGSLQKLVKSYGLDDKIFFHGFLMPADIDSLLESASLNVLASKDEGFGLSMIEAFAHGVPTVTFSDLDAVQDIYNADSMLLCKTRDTEALAETMYLAMEKTWCSSAIKTHSQKFSLQSMALNYNMIYKMVLLQGAVNT